MLDTQSILSEADALEQTAADLLARASRLRAIAGAAPGAPSGPSARELPPLDPKNPDWQPPGRAAEILGKANSTISAWLKADTDNRIHRKLGRRNYLHIPTILGARR